MDSYQGIPVGKVIHCEHGAVISTINSHAAVDPAGKEIVKFQPTTPDLNQNFIQAVRSRRPGDLVSDMLQGHLSAALVHLGNISYRVGKTLPDREIRERIVGNTELSAAYERFQTHLLANGVDLDKTPATLGALLTFDPAAERFVGEFSQAANQLVSREYRAPFVVPEKV
jgi:hypothetical protein